MSTETIFICDRCAVEHRGTKPIGWQTGVDVQMIAEGLPTHSPYHVTETFKHLCTTCCTQVSDAIKAVLTQGTPTNV